MSDTQINNRNQYVVALKGSQIRAGEIYRALAQAPNSWILADVKWWGQGNGNLQFTFTETVP